MTQGSNELHFFYDAQNRPAVVVYNGTAYAYVKSLQGDIVAILDENGNTVVSYGYDAWGSPLWCTGELAETLGKVQPFRYRGDVFDEETGLYYLRSRYYNPGWGRFVNADCVLGLKRDVIKNLFNYCKNSPASQKDTNGARSTAAEQEKTGVLAGIMDIVGAFHVSGSVGFGLRLHGEATVAGVPISLAAGAKIDPIAADLGNGQLQIGGAVANSVDVGIGPFFTESFGQSAFHPYFDTEDCTCNLNVKDMKDCPAADSSEFCDSQIGVGVEVYVGVGFSASASLDVEQEYHGILKIINGVSDWLVSIF